MRSPRTAIASATVNLSSTVMILPFVRIRSADGCCAETNTATALTNISVVVATENRLYSIIVIPPPIQPCDRNTHRGVNQRISQAHLTGARRDPFRRAAHRYYLQ